VRGQDRTIEMEDASSGVGQRHEDGACEAEIFLTRRRRAHVVEPDCTSATGGDRSVYAVCLEGGTAVQTRAADWVQ